MSNNEKTGSEISNPSSGWAGIGRMFARGYDEERGQAQPQFPIIISQTELMASQNEALKILKRNEFIFWAVDPNQEIKSQILRSNVKQISHAQNNIPVLIKRGDEAYIYRNIGGSGEWELTKLKEGLLTKIQDFPRVGDDPIRSKSLRSISENLYNEIIAEIRSKNVGDGVRDDLFHIPMAAALNDTVGTGSEQEVIEALGQFFTDLNRGLKINGVDGKKIADENEIKEETWRELLLNKEKIESKTLEMLRKEWQDKIASPIYMKEQILQRVARELNLDLTDVADRKLLILLGKSYNQEVLNLLPSCVQGAIARPALPLTSTQATAVQDTTHSPKSSGRVGKLFRSSSLKQTLESPVFIVDNSKSVKTANFIADKSGKNTRIYCVVELDNIHIRNTTKPEEPLIDIPGKLMADLVLTDQGFLVRESTITNDLLKKLVVGDHDIKDVKNFAHEVKRSLVSTWFNTTQSPPSPPVSSPPPSPSLPPSEAETPPSSPSPTFSIASLFIKEDQDLDNKDDSEGSGDFVLEAE